MSENFESKASEKSPESFQEWLKLRPKTRNAFEVLLNTGLVDGGMETIGPRIDENLNDGQRKEIYELLGRAVDDIEENMGKDTKTLAKELNELIWD